MKNLNHGTTDTILQEAAKALVGTSGPTQPHSLELTLRVECNPEIQDDHVKDIGYVSCKSSSQYAPLELDDEQVAANNLDGAAKQLDKTWHKSVQLGRKEPFSCVKLTHGPDTWHANDTILDSNL